MYRHRSSVAVALAVLLAAGAFGYWHVLKFADKQVTSFEAIVVLAFGMLVFTTVLPHFHRDTHVRTVGARMNLAVATVLTVIPAHNEDPTTFVACLDSIARQSKRPTWVYVVENGGEGYCATLGPIVDEWRRANPACGFTIVYRFNPVAGKREAQAIAFREVAELIRLEDLHSSRQPVPDIIMTLDSDVILGDEKTIEHGIAPMVVEPRHRTHDRARTVTSVCGFLLGKNWSRNGWTMLIDIGFIGSFLNGRASQSMVDSVAVNTGGLAFYRGWVVMKYLRHYLEHRIFGRQMQYGDDAMMTRYAGLEGATRFQRSSWGFTLHPENHRHLIKQRARWHRSWFWGNLWLIRHFPANRVRWWFTLGQFLLFIYFTVLIPYMLVIAPVRYGVGASGLFVAWLAFVAYLSMAPYLTVKRPDMTFKQQLGVWSLAPVAALMNFYIGWMLRYYGLATCLHTGWGTRQKVEVGMAIPRGASTVATVEIRVPAELRAIR